MQLLVHQKKDNPRVWTMVYHEKEQIYIANKSKISKKQCEVLPRAEPLHVDEWQEQKYSNLK